MRRATLSTVIVVTGATGASVPLPASVRSQNRHVGNPKAPPPCCFCASSTASRHSSDEPGSKPSGWLSDSSSTSPS
uniref:Putative secreted protein n=1 Tax=Ixodes ricinus TaxID=34613 RepID=A0A6B0U536_IXORI